MIVQFRLEIDDSTRGQVASLIDGKATKRLATRDEVKEVLESLWNSFARQVNQGTPLEETMKAKGIDPDSSEGRQYVQGWNKKPSEQ